MQMETNSRDIDICSDLILHHDFYSCQIDRYCNMHSFLLGQKSQSRLQRTVNEKGSFSSLLDRFLLSGAVHISYKQATLSCTPELMLSVITIHYMRLNCTFFLPSDVILIFFILLAISFLIFFYCSFSCFCLDSESMKLYFCLPIGSEYL